MIKKMLILFCFIMLLGVVFAEEWGDVRSNVSMTLNPENATEVTNEGSQENDDISQQTYNSPDYGVAETKYTNNFYIAVGVGTLAILLVLYVVYLFIRGPSVKWKKSKPIKQ
jgi:hypothetical protein